MSSKNGYVKWKVFTLIIMLIFGAISAMFARSIVLSDKINENNVQSINITSEIKEDLSSIKTTLEWLNKLKPKETNEVSALDQFIKNLELASK